MIEIRIHGRGGQGAVIASKILAQAAMLDGRFSQSFPAFGGERRGAPVVAYVRIDDQRIRMRYQIYKPDCIVVLDPKLFKMVDLTAGLKEGSTIVVNSSPNPLSVEDQHYKWFFVDASSISRKYELGPKTAPIVNTSILGAVIQATEVVKLDSLLAAIKESVPSKQEENMEAAKQAYTQVVGMRT
ncbi:MAG: 2-oxoacid:acceptor oxidoreductase family protein [Deltaproteobacteria bacterium]|nr:2-oxoacid:acceptor oxidoreductase family protein [Deltaproteobacteria bacterium]